MNDSPECRGGLNYLATHQATVTITTEGNDRKITRQLVDIPTDGDPSLKQPDEHHPDTGSTMRIPRERIISVAARYQRLTDTRSSCGSP